MEDSIPPNNFASSLSADRVSFTPTSLESFTAKIDASAEAATKPAYSFNGFLGMFVEIVREGWQEAKSEYQGSTIATHNIVTHDKVR